MSPEASGLTLSQQQGLQRLGADVTACLRHRVPAAAPLMLGYERLTLQSTAWVGRCVLEGGPVRSVIVKHLPLERYPSHPDQVPLRLREEILAYHFLHQVRDRFDRCPVLIGDGPGLLIIEDLAPLRLEQTAGELRAALAESFARLHLVGSRERARYERLRGEALLPPAAETGYPEWFGFLEGMREVRAWCEIFGLPPVDWAALIQEVHTTLRARAPFLTLIHQEMAASRNAVMTGRGLCLIDFERACLGHALIDLATTMIGHIEWNIPRQEYFLNHLNADLAFAIDYRAHWEALGGARVADEVWCRELAACLIFMALVAVGAARRAEVRYQAAQPLNLMLRTLLQRLVTFLEQLDALPPLAHTLKALVQQPLFFPPSLLPPDP